MTRLVLPCLAMALVAAPAAAWGADQKVAVRFQAVVGDQRFACGQTYKGIGVTNSEISPRDFRFYVHNVQLVDEAGTAVPVQLEQDDKWQLDDVALLDFEDATGGCTNGTPETNTQVVGVIPAGKYTAVRFTLGVPFNKNHHDLTSQPSPLNLTALFWAWNSGHKYLRLDFSSTGLPRGFAFHLGSAGCTPRETKITVPTACKDPNRVEIELRGFDPSNDVVVVDVAALLKGANVDTTEKKTMGGCMSGATDSECAPLFANFGLPFGGKQEGAQTVFRKASAPERTYSSAKK